MEIFENIKPLKNQLISQQNMGYKIGFVPTMGALHQGHLALVKQAKLRCEKVVCSIFVNPTQFNNPDDLKKYPRDHEGDLQKLKEAGCDYVFIPEYEEVYPTDLNIEKREYDFGDLEVVQEGKFRPGHFKGVAMVVHRLFEIVEPDFSFFGLKDYQQLLIIKELSKQYFPEMQIEAVAIEREKDGLAMSSRNLRLSPAQRLAAPIIYKSLQEAVNAKDKMDLPAVHQMVIENINANPLLKVEYFEIADALKLQPIENWEDASEIIGCIVVNVGEVRLIDNIIFS